MGGIRAALDLAEAGRDIVLIDKDYSIGGLMAKLDRTFPTNNCDLCTLSPHLSETGRRLHIELMTVTELTGLEGEAGSFQATLLTRPRFIDLQKCTACGDCYRTFPQFVRFTPGLDHRAPTCMRYPQATPYAFSIDREACPDMDELVRACPVGAILSQDTAREQKIEVGSVILSPGAEVFKPHGLGGYRYGVHPNVVTSLEYERILSASGPTNGELLRPSDGGKPRKIAWIQCVGSRGFMDGSVSYCSSACCMYALKEAIVTRERFQRDIETVIFYMDMRTYGKDYEIYLQRAVNEYGVKLVRSRPDAVEPVIRNGVVTGDLSISFLPQADEVPRTEVFDMVVLVTGFRISSDVRELAGRLGVELNEHAFARTEDFNPVATSRAGVYVCGLLESPKDIPDTIVQASAAACCALRDLSPVRAMQREEDYPPERDVVGEEPRIGVFVCDCGLDIGGIVNVEDLVARASTLPEVVVAKTVGRGCSRESIEYIQNQVRKHRLNRVVIGACSPRTREAFFQDAVRKVGLNKYLVEIANLRDQDTWVHLDQPGDAAEKAVRLLGMAVAAVRQARPLVENLLPMNKDVLVVGGGVAGMTASLSLADLGYRVNLVERSGQLGGVATKVRKTLGGEDVRTYLEQLVQRTEHHDRITVSKRAIVVDHSGIAGMFKTGIQVGPQMFYRQILHGITILATGALPNRPDAFLLGRHPAVTTQLELDSMIEDDPAKIKAWKDVVMIQCVGSRIPENPNCSHICCQAAVKNALRIKSLNPEAEIYILYRDMRTPGFEEDFYRKARDQGIIFMPFDPENKLRVEAAGEQVALAFTDLVLGREMEISADCLVLSTGLRADDESTEDLGMIFHIPRTSDGYFLENHVKLEPVDLSIPGFFVAGTAHSPKTIRDSIAQALAAAGRAQTFLARDIINLGAAAAQVDKEKCAACLICVRACPFNVPFINGDHSEIDPAKCHGCGTCASECPAGAIQLMQYEDDHLLAKVDGLFERIS
jgi:heterodisulfide reductase subunit A